MASRRLSWDFPQAEEGDIGSFRVQRRVQGAPAFDAFSAAKTVRHRDFADLVFGTVYEFKVQALDGNANVVSESDILTTAVSVSSPGSLSLGPIPPA